MVDLSISLDALDLCRPFFAATGLNAFSYSRIFHDGSRTELWSDAAALEHTFHKARYILGAYTPPFFKSNERYSYLEKKVETYPTVLRDKYRNQLRDQRELFDHCHCFVVFSQEQDFFEYFIFYAPCSNHMAINYYLNNIDQLELFSKKFIQQAKYLVHLADQQRIYSVECPTSTYRVKPSSSIGSLTQREKEIGRFLMTGATIKDIAKALAISPRTVESHLEKMKMKCDCTRKSILAQQLYLNKELLES